MRSVRKTSLVDRVSPQGRSARGLYITGPFVRRFGSERVANEVKKAGLSAVVLDLKTDRGKITYDTRIPELQKQKHLMADVPELVRYLKKQSIYTIARIVCFNDHRLAAQDLSRAIHDSRPHRARRAWVSWGTGTHWLDPYSGKNHDMIVQVAKEVAALGFDELQLDYIRFPVDRGTRFARYPAQKSTPRSKVLAGLLERIDRAVAVPLGVDVFGLTAFQEGDSSGLGQALEEWAPYVEVFSPMLYLNNMKSWGRRGSSGIPKRRAERLIRAGVATLRKRLGHAPVIRPYIQAFRPGADYFNARFIREQVKGSYDGGGDGFLFWHPGAHYKIVHRALAKYQYNQPSCCSGERVAKRTPGRRAGIRAALQ